MAESAWPVNHADYNNETDVCHCSELVLSAWMDVPSDLKDSNFDEDRLLFADADQFKKFAICSWLCLVPEPH